MTLFTDGKDLEGIECVEDIQYIKRLRVLSQLIAAWPTEGTKFYSYCIVLILLLSIVGEVVYLRIRVGTASAFDLGHQYISVFMTTVAIIRGIFVIMDKYNKIVVYFLNDLHLFNFRNVSNHAFLTHIAIHKLSHLYLSCITKVGIGAFLLFNLRPVVNNYYAGMFSRIKPANTTFETSLLYEMPFNYQTNLINYILISIFNCYVSGSCLIFFIVIDTVITFLVFHLWGHIKILIEALQSLPKPLAGSNIRLQQSVIVHFSEETNNEWLCNLKLLIKHHYKIIDFLAQMSDTFGEILLVHYTFLQISGCLMLLMVSPMNSESFARYGPLTLYCFQQLIQSSIIFELLDSSNDTLINTIYNLPWEYMHISYSRIVHIMLLQSQRPLKLKAKNMITVGVQTMIAILKTSFSYFLMIKTLAED